MPGRAEDTAGVPSPAQADPNASPLPSVPPLFSEQGWDLGSPSSSLCTRRGWDLGSVPQQPQHLLRIQQLLSGLPRGLTPGHLLSIQFLPVRERHGPDPCGRGKMAPGLYLLPCPSGEQPPSGPGTSPRHRHPQPPGSSHGAQTSAVQQGLDGCRARPGARRQVPGLQVLQQNLAGEEAVGHGGGDDTRGSPLHPAAAVEAWGVGVTEGEGMGSGLGTLASLSPRTHMLGGWPPAPISGAHSSAATALSSPPNTPRCSHHAPHPTLHLSVPASWRSLEELGPVTLLQQALSKH